MKHLMTFNERMTLKNYIPYIQRVTKAYKDAPDFEESENNESVQLKSKSAKGNRYFKMLSTGMFQHYDSPKGQLSPIGDEDDRRRLVSKLGKADKKLYREWLKTPEGKKSLDLYHPSKKTHQSLADV